MQGQSEKKRDQGQVRLGVQLGKRISKVRGQKRPGGNFGQRRSDDRCQERQGDIHIFFKKEARGKMMPEGLPRKVKEQGQEAGEGATSKKEN